MQDTPDAAPHPSPPWSRNTKRTVGLILLALLALLLWRFRGLLGQIVVAGLLAYLLGPLIRWLARRTPLSRGTATLAVYVALLLIVLAAVGLIGVAGFQQVSGLLGQLPDLLDRAVALATDLLERAQRPFAVGPFQFDLSALDWSAVEGQLGRLVEPALSGGQRIVTGVAGGAIGVLGWLAITFTISIYLALDLPRLGAQIAGIARQSGYAADFDRLLGELNSIGNAYLRGQALLGLVVGALTWILLTAIGVHNSFALGLLSGVLEVVPYFGPILSAVAAVLVAFFQPENYLGLGQVPYALLALGVMFLVQQLEGNFIVPRVMGDALNLRPLTVLIAVLIGGTLAGILGIILAAPVAAAIRTLGQYTWRKLLDLPPFPEPPPTPRRRGPTLARRLRALVDRLRGRAGD
jgi:predicted PurR-regulated permease PerM